ncbi:MAG: Transposase [Candidatus Kaiserbacteria bacterium GW2011_GWA2_52_12]|uniref:Transposase n=1 Tax=Candidatus Kaiserbacteria bacterium GW2011_GWA2_52_12 TaxID=1618671 RepID=A0A0G1Z875_9BACT|nr:MAG: Transposase [Candidatus Kaiserbacteria bacterium GW2011_GWA2_52_12]
MAYRRTPFQIDEWFHCYNRGIDKRVVFTSEDDSERFLQLLYLANSAGELRRDNISARRTEEIVLRPRGRILVSIGAYCLMPNHFHLLLKEITEGGITRFMQKLGTAYAMYFNTKNRRTGNLFVKPFRSRHVGEDRYFQCVVNYIHCNPAERFESGWKKGVVKSMSRLERKLRNYRYSSFPDYAGERRALSAILSRDGFDVYRNQTSRKMLEDCRVYYADIAKDDPDLHPQRTNEV